MCLVRLFKSMAACICRYIRTLSDLFFPRRCIVCHQRLNVYENYICTPCLADMPLTYFSNSKYNKMSECFNHLIDKKNNVFSKDKIDYVLATSLFFYNSDSGYSNITKELKYFGNIPSGRFFSKILGTSLRLSPYFNNVSVIIPVPLHWKRRLKRGYNQAEIISGELALMLSASMYNDILYRRRLSLIHI